MSGLEDGLGHTDDGKLVPTEPFDYDKIDDAVFQHKPETDLTEFSPEELEKVRKGLRVILQWIWQNGMKNTDGITIRAILACWIFLEELRPMELSQLARGFGKQKQSLGRWHDDFKRCFPNIKTCHMR